MESSIEISKDGSVFCDHLCDFDVNSFLMIFALTAKEQDYRYFKMRDGMVNFNKKDIVISFGIEVYPTSFYVNNCLSSFDFEVAKKFIADMYNL